MATTSRQIELKSEKDLERMRRAGQATAKVFTELSKIIAPGISTKELNRLAHKIIRQIGGYPAFLGYRGFPASICASVNEEVVHGLPSAKKKLRDGDIIGIDIGVTLDGFIGDAAYTYEVGSISADKQKLLNVTKKCLQLGISKMTIGNRLGDISYAIQQHAESNGFSVVRDFVGHGIGRQMHEEPAVPNYGTPGTGPRLEAGMVLALEPMLIAGGHKVCVISDGWTVISEDHGDSAHYEHTVAVTHNGPEILTDFGSWTLETGT